ncbi:MAG: S1 RNA-binding domain-containing protein [Spirochaetales bacterium]|nr:S1 RNA-binding domain-containing protein [Leptospiraceae bacterium]MCP5481165.1 S1 RNA-binding domain-containing protein [Spirochaetales bacterium]
MKSKQIGKDRAGDNEFSRMLEENLESLQNLEPGTPVSLSVTNNRDKNYVFVKSEYGPGVIDRAELVDADDNVEVTQGERLTAFYRETVNGEIVFTTVPSGQHRQAIVQSALQGRIPIRGRIARKIKGGFEIQMGDVTAFCPQSQMDDPELRGAQLYLITEAEGKRVIASRRAYRDWLREIQKERYRETLHEGDVVTGQIVSLQDFGAFLDLGGLECLIPISELAYNRIRHPSEVVRQGETVRARVLSIDWKEDRITLSRRALLDNPWQGALPFSEGDIVEGRVESLKPFGLFVRITDNFTGLVPISETDVPRGGRLEDHYQRGKRIRVMIQNIERGRQRIRLSIRQVVDADTRKEYESYMSTQEKPAEEISSFGKQLLASLNKPSN